MNSINSEPTTLNFLIGEHSTRSLYGLLLIYVIRSDASANVNTIKHMLAGLSEFQEGKNSYTLHLNMAQECMKIFQNHKLMDISSVEQVSYVHN